MNSFSDLKATHRAVRENLNSELSIRIHRSLSWLGQAETQKEDLDASFIFYWIAFNAAYAGNFDDAEHYSESSAFSHFFQRIVKNDSQNRVYSLIWERFPHEINGVLRNEYIFSSFWKENDFINDLDWKASFEASIVKVNHALKNQDTIVILSILFSRIYVLRNQIFHGGATWNSSVNRTQVKDCTKLLANLVPILIKIMMASPEENWGTLNYPLKEK